MSKFGLSDVFRTWIKMVGFLLANGVQEDGVAHLGLHVKVSLGDGRMHGGAATERAE